MATFVKTLQQWTMELGFSVPQCKANNKQPIKSVQKLVYIDDSCIVSLHYSSTAKVWDKLIALGQEDRVTNGMEIQPYLLGERNAPDATASATGITLDTLQLGHVFRALCSGIIKNLHK